MKPQTNPLMVALSGFPVRVDQIRDLQINGSQRAVILENGMKIEITEADRDMLLRVMNLRKTSVTERASH